jgi:translocation and assembly module TamA
VTGPRPSRAAAAALLLAGATGCFLRYPPATPDRPRVDAFEIEGTHVVSDGELMARLATQPSHRKYKLLPQPEYFDPDAFDNDKRRIVRFYQERGYFHARIEEAEVEPVEPGVVRIRVRVSEGQPVRVTLLETPGIEGAPEARARLRRLPLQQGDVFTESAYDATREAILKALVDSGWARAEVTQRAQIDLVLDQVHVRYNVTPGERYRFGSTFVAGAVAVPRPRIRAEAEAAVRPGEIFDASRLPAAQAGVFDLGVFGGVRVFEGPPDEQRRTIPVVVAVREAPFRTIRAGPAFQLQLTRYEVDATVGWSHRNWLGGLRKLTLDARVGYAWLPTFFKPTQRGFVGLAAADFTQPAVITRRVDLNLHAEVERGIEQGYDFWAERLRFGLPTRLFGRLLTFIPSVNFELYEIGGNVGAAAQTSAATAAQTLQLATCPGHDPSRCLITYFEQRIGLDLRDDPIHTRKGFFIGLSVQEGFSLFGNGTPYLRVLPELRAFASLPFDTVLAVRARIGLIDTPGNTEVPIVSRFTSGGPNSMRGYYTRQLSPVLQACPEGQAVASPPPNATPAQRCKVRLEYVPVGGNGLVDGSFELRFPVSGALGGAAFLDFGNVPLSAKDVFDLSSLQFAVGTGIRYNTLFGPLRLDVAVRLPKAGDGQPGVPVLNLSADGRAFVPATEDGTPIIHHSPIVSVHLSIGEAF